MTQAHAALIAIVGICLFAAYGFMTFVEELMNSGIFNRIRRWAKWLAGRVR